MIKETLLRIIVTDRATMAADSCSNKEHWAQLQEDRRSSVVNGWKITKEKHQEWGRLRLKSTHHIEALLKTGQGEQMPQATLKDKDIEGD